MKQQKLHQVPLVTASGSPQPPFPGGWVLAIFEAVHTFAPAFASSHQLPVSRRTEVRINGGEPIPLPRYEQLKTHLVNLVAALFPTVSGINEFGIKYVDEYLRLWHRIATFYHEWAGSLGYPVEASKVLGRTFLRDLFFRVCYLESCERMLTGHQFSNDELSLLHRKTPASLYSELISKHAKKEGIALEKLAVGLGAYDKKIRRLMKGAVLPEWSLLTKLVSAQPKPRLLAGIGFFDVLLRELEFDHKELWPQMFRNGAMFFPAHIGALKDFANRTKPQIDAKAAFREFASFKDSLLEHAGFKQTWPQLPDALSRVHLYSLGFACMDDLARAYLHHAKPGSETELVNFFETAELKSGGCPNQWWHDLRQVEIDHLNP